MKTLPRSLSGKTYSGQSLKSLVEQANGVVENKIRAWKIDNGSTKWHEALLEVTLAINMQVHSAINQTPYNVVFRQPFNSAAWAPRQERQEEALSGTSYIDWM